MAAELPHTRTCRPELPPFLLPTANPPLPNIGTFARHTHTPMASSLCTPSRLFLPAAGRRVLPSRPAFHRLSLPSAGGRRNMPLRRLGVTDGTGVAAPSGPAVGEAGGSAGEEVGVGSVNGELKRCLVDSFYGTEFGLRASTETRAEVLELVNQLEAKNPTPAPNQAAALLGGKWLLLYTAFSELLPLLAAGALPLLKLKQISQVIDTLSNTIKNSATFTGPLGTFSFSALATFEVRSPSRIQIQFKEGVIPPPELSSNINLPKVDIYGTKVDLAPLENNLKPLEDLVANIARTISGQPPLKVPIPGERNQSWLVTTYLDEDLRISRGDAGLFVLVKEGSTYSAGS